MTVIRPEERRKGTTKKIIYQGKIEREGEIGDEASSLYIPMDLALHAVHDHIGMTMSFSITIPPVERLP